MTHTIDAKRVIDFEFDLIYSTGGLESSCAASTRTLLTNSLRLLAIHGPFVTMVAGNLWRFQPLLFRSQ